jgi:8-oxo-dGTP pyrophosphatase MutT (NUDIX family)
MAYPPVVIVDDSDKVVGSAPLADAWEKGLIHRIVFVIVWDDTGRVLLHRRDPNMQLFAGRWDTAGGHVDVTPDYEESARLELSEETGLDGGKLTELAHLYTDDPYDNGVRAKRFVKIYSVNSNHHGEPGEGEVTELRWFTPAEVAELAKDAGQIADGLHRSLPFILKKS